MIPHITRTREDFATSSPSESSTRKWQVQGTVHDLYWHWLSLKINLSGSIFVDHYDQIMHGRLSRSIEALFLQYVYVINLVVLATFKKTSFLQISELEPEFHFC